MNNFVKFLVACGIAAAANFGSRIIFGLYFSYSISIVLAYIVGITTAYVLCRQTVFTSNKNNRAQEIFYFTAVNGFAILQTLLVSLLLERHGLRFVHDQFIREEIAHFVGICVPAFSSYFGHKYLSFR